VAGNIAGSNIEHQRFMLMARRVTNFAGSKIECPKDSLKGELQDVIRNGRTPVVTRTVRHVDASISSLQVTIRIQESWPSG